MITFSSVSFCDQPFSIYNVVWTKWPQIDLEDLAVKSTLYTLNMYPRCPYFFSFCSAISRFRDTSVSKSEIPWMISNWLEHLTVKSTLHTLNSPKAQTSLRFSSFRLINYSLGFPYMLQWWTWNFTDKILTIGNSKFQTAIVRTIENKFQQRFGIFESDLKEE